MMSELLTVEEIVERVNDGDYDKEEANFGNIELAQLKDLYWYAKRIEELEEALDKTYNLIYKNINAGSNTLDKALKIIEDINNPPVEKGE